MRVLAALLVIGAGICSAERLDCCATLLLENDTLQVELYADRPAPLTYVHKPTGERLSGSGPDGVWRLNGQDLPWSRWRVEPFRRSDKTAVAYEMTLLGTGLKLQVRFVLREAVLEIRIENIADPDRVLETLEWVDMPLLSCRHAGYEYWREVWRGARWSPLARPVWWCRPESGRVGDAAADIPLRPTIHSCVYKPESVCAFVTSNSRHLPLLDGFSEMCAANAYTMSLNAYHARTDGKSSENLRASVVFLQDLNQDGRCDPNDYAVWMNRRLPNPPDAIFKTALWYRLQPTGTVDDALELFRQISNVTAGLPQVCQIAERKDQETETAQRLAFAVEAKKYNVLLSWERGISAGPLRLASLEEPEATPPVDMVDAEDGHLAAVHLAAFYGNGGSEGLYGSLLPALDAFHSRGVSVTAESTCGLPVEMSGLFSGVWRFEPPLDLLPLYHGNVIAGSPAETSTVPFGYGCGLEGLTCGDVDWPDVLDQIYLRALLYHFYLEREWLDTERLPAGHFRLRFSRDTMVVAGPGPDSLNVQAGGVTVAVGTDRFIPRGDVIYAYSRDGSTRWWTLPEGWNGQPLYVLALALNGPEPGHKATVRQGKIRLQLDPRTPVMVTRGGVAAAPVSR